MTRFIEILRVVLRILCVIKSSKDGVQNGAKEPCKHDHGKDSGDGKA